MGSGTAHEVMRRADALASLSEEPGRITRPYGTPSLRSAMDMADGWMREAGLATRRDALGSLVGRRGAGPLPVLGSHLDSVRDAGRYDGPLGVLVAVAAAERTAAEGLPVSVVAFADEEGMRYPTSYLASRAAAGTLDPSWLDLADADGVPLRDAVRAMGGAPDDLASCRWDPADVAAYIEVHIEQGPVLEERGLPVGIVTAIAGQTRGTATFTGMAGHAGTVPPAMRHDALAAAAEWIGAVEREAAATPGLVATVGRIDVAPNVGNVIAAEASATFDVRHAVDAVRLDAVTRIRAAAEGACARRGCGLGWRTTMDEAAVPFAPGLRARLADAVAGAGVPILELTSGAGHDAVQMSSLGDVAMLFVRCAGGVSHNPAESVTEEDVSVAIDVTCAMLRGLARA